MNRTARRRLRWRTPYEVVTGTTPDRSNLFIMPYRTKVYYKRYTSGKAAQPKRIIEEPGLFVGFAENIGHSLTFKIYSLTTDKIIYRSRVRIARDIPNIRSDRISEEHKAQSSDDRVLTQTVTDQGNGEKEEPLEDINDDSEDDKIREVPTTESTNDVPTPLRLSDIDERGAYIPGVTNVETEVLRRKEETNEDQRKWSVYDTVLGDFDTYPSIELDHLKGRSFLEDVEDGERVRTTIHEVMKTKRDGIILKVKSTLDDKTRERLVSYNEALDFINDNC